MAVAEGVFANVNIPCKVFYIFCVKEEERQRREERDHRRLQPLSPSVPLAVAAARRRCRLPSSRSSIAVAAERERKRRDHVTAVRRSLAPLSPSLLFIVGLPLLSPSLPLSLSPSPNPCIYFSKALLKVTKSVSLRLCSRWKISIMRISS
ncbi:hypothetical protein LWI29_034333 [Acer saccharum]|uniref:Uncharacterized protein n=1 Tax=Acer saccharum TaxID=4024 RepID=A0AA39TAT0_ACESA|nr:hypothetical protein LWI29_034333 [Acer saccharum]